jgi:diguanylate cyclase (GGDEF)-like protein/PAS domain S-box-containing protein
MPASSPLDDFDGESSAKSRDRFLSIHDENGYFLSTSENLASLLDWQPGELIGRNLRELIHDKDLERLLGPDSEARLPSHPIRYRLRTGDGEYVRVETTYELYCYIDDEKRYAMKVRKLSDSVDESKELSLDAGGASACRHPNPESFEVSEVVGRLLENLSKLIESQSGMVLLNPKFVDEFPSLRGLADCVVATREKLGPTVWRRYQQVVETRSIASSEDSENWWAVPIECESRLLACVYLPDVSDTNIADFGRIAESFASQTSTALKCLTLFDEYKQQAQYDHLTGALSRYHFLELANRQLRSARRYRYPLSALMIDVDHFKAVNDDYGHKTGDKALKKVVERLKNSLREVDLLGRYGGEEFVAILPHTSIGVAYATVAERLRVAVGDDPIRLNGGRELSLTISIGVAALDRRTATVKNLIDRADGALLTAKEEGRNCISVASQSSATAESTESNNSKVIDFNAY